MKKMKKEFFSLCIILFLALLSSKALFHTGFFRTVDDITTVRIVYLVKELQRNYWLHNFPVRIFNSRNKGSFCKFIHDIT